MLSKEEKRIFYDYMNGLALYKPNDKLNNINNLIRSFLNKTLTMFLYDGLPESIDYVELEKLLQIKGLAFITEYKDNLVVLPIDLLFDDVDVYGNASKGNVYFNDTREIKTMNIEEGVLIKNDYLGIGLMEILKKYAFLINESTTTLYLSNLWKRTEKVFTANDDGTAESVKNYLEKVKNGELGIITTSLLYESINVKVPQSIGTSLHDLIEYDNYIKSEFYNEIGLYHYNNMKKERLITSEVEVGKNSVYPLVDNMLNSRKKGLKELNEKYNLNVKVEFTSSWELRFNLGENISKLEGGEEEEKTDNLGSEE
ncbi:MAG: hypothetical protein GX889_02235 [Clostridiales bacterium]|nr:hypothetical protein [Clostridiales bacterium]